MQTINALSPEIEAIAEEFRAAGLSVELSDLPSGGKGIVTSTSGIPFSSFLFANEERKSPYLMMSAMFPDRSFSTDWANRWNNRFPLTRASVSPTGEPMLTHSVILTGVDAAHLREVLQWWDLLLRIFVDDILSEGA